MCYKKYQIINKLKKKKETHNLNLISSNLFYSNNTKTEENLESNHKSVL